MADFGEETHCARLAFFGLTDQRAQCVPVAAVPGRKGSVESRAVAVKQATIMQFVLRRRNANKKSALQGGPSAIFHLKAD
jgi:hypothetical protein